MPPQIRSSSSSSCTITNPSLNKLISSSPSPNSKPPRASAGAGPCPFEAPAKKDVPLFSCMTSPLLVLFLLLAFGRRSLSFVFLYMAVIVPLSHSLFVVHAWGELPSKLGHKHFRRLFLGMLALSCALAASFATVARPSCLLEIGLYLSFVAWREFIDAALELPPILSLFFRLQTAVFVLFPSFYQNVKNISL